MFWNSHTSKSIGRYWKTGFVLISFCGYAAVCHGEDDFRWEMSRVCSNRPGQVRESCLDSKIGLFLSLSYMITLICHNDSWSATPWPSAGAVFSFFVGPFFLKDHWQRALTVLSLILNLFSISPLINQCRVGECCVSWHFRMYKLKNLRESDCLLVLNMFGNSVVC